MLIPYVCPFLESSIHHLGKLYPIGKQCHSSGRGAPELFLMAHFNYLPARHHFCRLLLIFATSIDPDQARRNIRPDLDPNCLTLRWYS